jgi:hypothetical protein
MKKLLLLVLILFASNVYAQEKKIKKAIEALNENNLEECYKYLEEYTLSASAVPLATYVEYLINTKKESPNYDIEKGFEKIQIVSQWMSSNTPDKGWCKSFGLCTERISSQMDSIAILALKNIEKDRSEYAYLEFIKKYTNIPANKIAVDSYQSWKYELAVNQNTIEAIALYIKDFPNSKLIPLAQKKLEDKEFEKCSTTNNLPCFKSFIQKYPESKYILTVKAKIEELDYILVNKEGNKESYEKFILSYPSSKYAEEVKKKIEELKNGTFVICSGQGKNFDEAQQKALRNAIELTFGMFVSSNTEIFNDSLIVDQISTISSGNINSIEVLQKEELPIGGFAVTLKAFVSVASLTSFVEAKGYAAELKGELFTTKIKQQILNEQSEIEAITNMFAVIHETMQTAFNYSVSVSDPTSLDSENEKWKIEVNVSVAKNKNFDFAINYMIKTLEALCLSQEEQQDYLKLNKKVYPLLIKNVEGKTFEFYLRKKYSYSIIETFVNQIDFYFRNFEVKNELHSCYSCGQGKTTQALVYDDDRELGKPLINIPKVHRLTYYDTFKLRELDKIKTYTIQPLGIRSKIKNGGFLIYEENGHGMVLSLADQEIGIYYDENWKVMIEKLNNSNFSNNKEWKLPSKAEMEIISSNFFSSYLPRKSYSSSRDFNFVTYSAYNIYSSIPSAMHNNSVNSFATFYRDKGGDNDEYIDFNRLIYKYPYMFYDKHYILGSISNTCGDLTKNCSCTFDEYIKNDLQKYNFFNLDFRLNVYERGQISENRERKGQYAFRKVKYF